jgi:hypothetical protein
MYIHCLARILNPILHVMTDCNAQLPKAPRSIHPHSQLLMGFRDGWSKMLDGCDFGDKQLLTLVRSGAAAATPSTEFGM